MTIKNILKCSKKEILVTLVVYVSVSWSKVNGLRIETSGEGVV